jgi:type I restriction enzyme, S subunit
MEVNKGYKQTEVGPIPEDWEVKPLGGLCIKIQDGNYGGDYPKSHEFLPYGVPFLTSKAIGKDGALKDNLIDFISKEKHSDLKKAHIEHNDILFTNRGASVGAIGYVDHRIAGGNIGPQLTLMRAFSEIISPKFLFQSMKSFAVQKQILSQDSGSAMNFFSITATKKFKVPLALTIKEQTAIATALSDTDALIQSMEKLIAKKRSIKQGAMQELLTGRIRLPGFSRKNENYKKTELGMIPEDWRACRFEDVLTGFSSGMTPYRGRPEYYKGVIPWITSGELNYNVITDTKEKITKEAVIKTNLKILTKGTFLMAITGLEAEGTRGSCGIVGLEATTNQSCMALYPIEGQIITDYLYYFYVLYGDMLALKYCQGTKQQSYTGKIVKTLPINIPPSLAEQTTIVKVLSDMDAEITVLESKLAKYKQIKQGMMQTLLTGRIRLV